MKMIYTSLPSLPTGSFLWLHNDTQFTWYFSIRRVNVQKVVCWMNCDGVLIVNKEVKCCIGNDLAPTSAVFASALFLLLLLVSSRSNSSIIM